MQRPGRTVGQVLLRRAHTHACPHTLLATPADHAWLTAAVTAAALPLPLPLPRQVTYVLRRREDQLLVLASDGLWDVFSNDEARALALDKFKGELARTGSSKQVSFWVRLAA